MSGSKGSYQRARRAAIKAGTWNPRGSKTETQAKNAAPTIPTAKTIDEANALAVSLGIAKTADFTGLDIGVANLLIQRLAEIRQQFPQLKELNLIGNTKIMGRSRGAGSFWSAFGVPIGLTLREKDFKPRALAQTLENLKKAVQQNISPIGCDTIKSLIDHEIGHYLDYGRVKGTGSTGLQLARDSEIYKLWDGMSNAQIEKGLSKYATKDLREFIAESWSEYQNNPNPRPIAKAVGDRIIEVYRESENE